MIYKYFTHETHAQSFIKGRLLMRPISYFRALEADRGTRGDRRDGILTYRPSDGLQMNMQDGRVITVKAGSFNSSVRENDVFVFCASNTLSEDLAKQFGSFCVEVDSDCLVRRLKQRAHPSSRFDYDQVISGNVDYRADDCEPGADWALPEKLALIKPQCFAGQDEFRIALGRRNAYTVYNVDLTIQATAATAAGVAPIQSCITLKIGELENETKLHGFRSRK